nr:hypothetical protein [uncultured Dethiosulfovibrio sp.]
MEKDLRARRGNPGVPTARARSLFTKKENSFAPSHAVDPVVVVVGVDIEG